MKKNEILNRLIEGLLDQRQTFVLEISQMNHNESSLFERRTTLENGIMHIDGQINLRVMDLELSN